MFYFHLIFVFQCGTIPSKVKLFSVVLLSIYWKRKSSKAIPEHDFYIHQLPHFSFIINLFLQTNSISSFSTQFLSCLNCYSFQEYPPVCAQPISHIQLWDSMDDSPPCSSIPGIFQARILEQVAIPFRGSSWPRDWICIFCLSCIGRQILYHWTTWEAPRLPSPM